MRQQLKVIEIIGGFQSVSLIQVKRKILKNLKGKFTVTKDYLEYIKKIPENM